MLEKYTNIWDKIKYHIQTINAGKSYKYEKDYMRIKFNSDHDSPLNKILKLHMLTIIVRSVFEEDGKCHPQVFLDDCLYEVYMLEYDGIDISKGININKTNASKDCDICHYCYFLDNNFKYELYLCNGCHDLMQKAMNFNDVTIASSKGNDYSIQFWYASKDDAISIMNNSNLIEKTGL